MVIWHQEVYTSWHPYAKTGDPYAHDLCALWNNRMNHEACKPSFNAAAEVPDAARHPPGDSCASVQAIPAAGAHTLRGVHCIPEVKGAFASLGIFQQPPCVPTLAL